MPSEVLELLAVQRDGLILYQAGLASARRTNGYSENFSRDVIEAALTSRNHRMLHAVQLIQ